MKIFGIVFNFLKNKVFLLKVLCWFFTTEKKINRIIKKVRIKNIFFIETKTYILDISENNKNFWLFENKKTKWKNNLSNSNSRTKDPLFKELKEWFLKLEGE